LSKPGRKAPDLILLDLHLPKTEGVDVLRAVRNMPKLADVPVVILTSSNSPADMHRTALLGAARFISKPSGLNDFLREVGRGVEEMLQASGW
jgi:CheY-like chemotaxis protein